MGAGRDIQLGVWVLFGVVGRGLAMEDSRWTMPLSYDTERVRRPYYGPAGIRASRDGGTLQVLLRRIYNPLPLNARRTTD